MPLTDRLAAGLDRSENRAPDRMAGLLGLEVHGRIDGERLAEFVAAGTLPARSAMDEGEVLMRADPVAAVQSQLDGALQALHGFCVLPFLVLLEADTERLLGLGRLKELLHLANRLALATGERKRE